MRYSAGMISRSSLLALALTVSMPMAAFAQAAPAGAVPPAPHWTPSPEMQAQMQRAHDDMRAAALAQLSPAHRSEIQAIIEQVNSGKLSDLKDATNRIDSVLSYNEAKAILAQGKKQMAAMHGGFRRGGPPGAPGSGPPPGAAVSPPGAAPPGPVAMGPQHAGNGWGPRGHRGHHHWSRRMHRAPDAGMLLLMVSVNRDRMHALMMQRMPGMRNRPGGPPPK
jgi:hypothetical protein